MFRLARELGYPHPDYLNDVLTSRQITELQAYDIIDPVGAWRGDYNAAMLASVLVNIQKAKNGEDARVAISDFIPRWGEVQELQKQSDEKMLAIMNAMAK